MTPGARVRAANRAGFTLVELLMVVAIIGLAAGAGGGLVVLGVRWLLKRPS